MFALGASSGGAFVLVLALRFPLAAVCAQIMAVPGHYLKSPPKDPQGDDELTQEGQADQKKRDEASGGASFCFLLFTTALRPPGTVLRLQATRGPTRQRSLCTWRGTDGLLIASP